MGIADETLTTSGSGTPETEGPVSGWRRLLAELGILLAFIAGAAYLMWPVTRHLASAVPYDLGDPLENAWTFAWPAHALLQQPLHLFHANIFYPESLGYAYTENMLGLSIFVAPVFWLSHNALLTVNLGTLLTYAVGGFCSYLLVRDLTSKRGPGLVAGAAYMMAPYRVATVGHIHVIALHLLPLVFLLLLRMRRLVSSGSTTAPAGAAPARASRWPGALKRPMWRLSLGLAVVFALQMWGSITGGFITLTAVGVWVLWELIRLRQRSLKVLLPALVGGALGMLLSLPVLIPYAVLHHRHPEFQHPLAELLAFSAHVRDYLNPPTGGPLVKPAYRALSTRFGQGANSELILFPGFFLCAGAVLSGVAMVVAFLRAKVKGRKAPAWTGLVALFATLAVAGLVLTLGPRLGHSPSGLPLPFAPFTHLPGGALRVPARFVSLVLFGMAVAIGVALGVARPVLRNVVVVLSLLVIGAEAMPPSYPVVHAPPITAVDRMVAQSKGAVLALPTITYDGGGNLIISTLAGEAEQMYLSTANFRPLVNGYGAYEPASFFELARHVQDFPTLASLTLLRNEGILTIEVQLHLVPGTPWEGVVARLDAWPGVKLIGADSQVRVYDISGFQA